MNFFISYIIGNLHGSFTILLKLHNTIVNSIFTMDTNKLKETLLLTSVF